MSIQVENLSKFYGDQQAVKDVSFTINKGEIVGFLGPNGAGKSTTMKMLTGYLVPDGGSVNILDTAVTPEETRIRKHIGYLPEHNPVYLDMYVREYLLYVARLYNTPASRIKEVIDLTGLKTEAHKIIRDLSKGYRQRVGIAQAILHDPEILILDEPTSGLDPNQLVDIRNLIKQLGETKTILFSTHIMQEVQALCDRVIIIDKGAIAGDGSWKSMGEGYEGLSTVIITLSRPVFDASWREIEAYRKHELIGENRYAVTGVGSNLNEQLFDFAVSKNLKILEMQLQQTSVENLFQKLTRKSS